MASQHQHREYVKRATIDGIATLTAFGSVVAKSTSHYRLSPKFVAATATYTAILLTASAPASAVSLGFALTETKVICTKPWELGQPFKDRRVEFNAEEISQCTTGLGFAEALATATPAAGAPGALPIIRSRIVADAEGETGSGSNHLLRNISVSGAEATHRIVDDIVFKKVHIAGPDAEYFSLSLVLDGTINAEAAVSPPPAPHRSYAFANAVHRVNVTFDGDVVRKNFRIEEVVRAGVVPGKGTDLLPVGGTFTIHPIKFAPADGLEIFMQFTLGGNAISDWLGQVSGFDGLVDDSVYFTGLELYDGDLSPLPPGAYTAIGVAGIDWMLSNIVEGPEAVPAPEPTTLALMGLGLAGIGYRRHRSKKAA